MNKQLYVIIGYNIVDGIYCNGIFEDEYEANQEVMSSPEGRRVIKANYFPKNQVAP
jgi:hypothetical protein